MLFHLRGARQVGGNYTFAVNLSGMWYGTSVPLLAEQAFQAVHHAFEHAERLAHWLW